MTTTPRMRASDIYKDWHVIDAADRPLGRVATEAATLLRGKHKPTYEPHLDDGDFVIIVNASKVRLTGAKAQQMTYYRHSGYPGGLKSRSYTEMMERFPDRVIERAVKGMLPSGPLGKAMGKHLKVYRGPKHPHESQVIGSERARATREALQAEAAGRDRTIAPRLHPLPGTKPPEPEPVVETAAVAEAPSRGRFRRRRGEAAPVGAAPTAEELTEAAVLAEPVEDIVGEAPAAEADAPATAAELTEAAVMAEPVEEVVEEAPETEAEAAPEASETESPAPARRPSRRRTRTQE